MNLHNATPRRPHEAEPDWERPSIHVNVPAQTRRRAESCINYATIFILFLLSGWLARAIWEAM